MSFVLAYPLAVLLWFYRYGVAMVFAVKWDNLEIPDCKATQITNSRKRITLTPCEMTLTITALGVYDSMVFMQNPPCHFGLCASKQGSCGRTTLTNGWFMAKRFVQSRNILLPVGSLVNRHCSHVMWPVFRFMHLSHYGFVHDSSVRKVSGLLSKNRDSIYGEASV